MGIAKVWERVRRGELTESERGDSLPERVGLLIVYTILRKVYTSFL